VAEATGGVAGDFEVRGRSVVLAGGGFESVRLAMASGLPDRSGRMGKAVVDHLFCRAYYPVPTALWDPERPEAAIVTVPAGDQRYQLEIHMPGDDLFAQSEHSVWEPHQDRAYSAMVRSFGAVVPRDENCVEVGSGGGPGDYTVHFAYSEADLALLDQMVEGLDQVRAALGAAPADEVQAFSPGDSHHEAGGMAMGDDPATSVTDPFGRVYGAPSVVVADAAAWPTVTPANPCLTITALARRQAQQLDRDLATG
jgi:choline dehydrogenase-like flavoprotein